MIFKWVGRFKEFLLELRRTESLFIISGSNLYFSILIGLPTAIA